MTILFPSVSGQHAILGTPERPAPDIASATIIPVRGPDGAASRICRYRGGRRHSAYPPTLAVNMLTATPVLSWDLYASLIKTGEATAVRRRRSTTAAPSSMTLFTSNCLQADIGVINNFAIAGGAVMFSIPMLPNMVETCQ